MDNELKKTSSYEGEVSDDAASAATGGRKSTSSSKGPRKPVDRRGDAGTIPDIPTLIKPVQPEDQPSVIQGMEEFEFMPYPGDD